MVRMMCAVVQIARADGVGKRSASADEVSGGARNPRFGAQTRARLVHMRCAACPLPSPAVLVTFAVMRLRSLRGVPMIRERVRSLHRRVRSLHQVCHVVSAPGVILSPPVQGNDLMVPLDHAEEHISSSLVLMTCAAVSRCLAARSGHVSSGARTSARSVQQRDAACPVPSALRPMDSADGSSPFTTRHRCLITAPCSLSSGAREMSGGARERGDARLFSLADNRLAKSKMGTVQRHAIQMLGVPGVVAHNVLIDRWWHHDD